MPDSDPKPSLTVTRTFAAPPQRVFDAWVDPAQRTAWWCAQPGMVCDLCDIDARPGGRYRINMKTADGANEFITVGEFLELDPPHRLVFTWGWEKPTQPVLNTKVTVSLRPVDGGTELTLSHTGFPAPDIRDEHQSGWSGCFKSLAQLLHG